MSMGFQGRFSRQAPLRVLRVLTGVWLIVLGRWLIAEFQRPPLPSPTDLDVVAIPPPRDPVDVAGRDWPLAQGATPPSPFISRFFESLLIYQAYEMRSDDYLPLPHGFLDAYDHLPDPTPAPELPPPPTEHLRYRGQIRHPSGAPVAFVENLETGQTTRFRIGERINGLVVEKITRHGMALSTEQGTRVTIAREAPVQTPAAPDAPQLPMPGSSTTNAVMETVEIEPVEP